MPDTVERQSADGEFERVAVRQLAAGDRIRVLPGEVFPADGTVIAGADAGRRSAADGRVARLVARRGTARGGGQPQPDGHGHRARRAHRRADPVRRHRCHDGTRVGREAAAGPARRSHRQPVPAGRDDRQRGGGRMVVVRRARARAQRRGGRADRHLPLRLVAGHTGRHAWRRPAGWRGGACWCAACRRWRRAPASTPWCSTRPAP